MPGPGPAQGPPARNPSHWPVHPFMMQELNLKPSNSLGQGWARARLFVSVAVDSAKLLSASLRDSPPTPPSVFRRWRAAATGNGSHGSSSHPSST